MQLYLVACLLLQLTSWLVVGLGPGLGLDSASGFLVVVHTYLCHFPVSLSHACTCGKHAGSISRSSARYAAADNLEITSFTFEWQTDKH